MGALPSQKYEEVCNELLKHLYDEYKVGFKDEKAMKIFVIEFLVKCNNGEIDIR